MFKDLPDGVCMVTIRHAESKRNINKAKQVRTNRKLAIRTADDVDSNLSAMGMIEALLAGPYIRKRFKELVGIDELQLLATSQSTRAIDTGSLIKRAWESPPRFEIQRIEIGEMRHWLEKHAGIHLITSMRDVADVALTKLDPELASTMDPEELKRATTSYFFSMLASELGEQLVTRAMKDNLADPMTWRKLEEGEDYSDLLKRLRKIVPILVPYIDLGVRTLTVVTHARTKIASWDMLEPNLPAREVQKILKSEGPPYPSHVGMTFYVSEKGRFRRVGDRNEIPSEFKTDGRLLDFADSFTGEQLMEVCKTLGLTCRIKPSDLNKPVPSRTVSGTMRAVSLNGGTEKVSLGLAKAKAVADDSEKKAS